MHDAKTFRKTIRAEMEQLSSIIKRLEFSIARQKGRERQTLRRKLAGLKRFRHYIALGLHHMSRKEEKLSAMAVAKVKANLEFIKNGCRQLETQVK
jgi:hypothetical protein